jgi:hypothetical protein
MGQNRVVIAMKMRQLKSSGHSVFNPAALAAEFTPLFKENYYGIGN